MNYIVRIVLLDLDIQLIMKIVKIVMKIVHLVLFILPANPVSAIISMSIMVNVWNAKIHV